MNNFLLYLLQPASAEMVQLGLCIMRIGIGLLTLGHGIPKIVGGIATWQSLGMAMNNVGIYFLPIFWGFLGASTEFFGGIALVLGLGTRIASFFLTLMMVVAFFFHYHKGDTFQVYSFALTMIIIFMSFFIIGAGKYSLDYYLTR